MAKYKIISLPKKAEYMELDLTPEEIEEYAKGGYIIEDISVPQLSMQDGGIVELDGYQFKQDAQGNWRYTSGAPVADRALIQRLTYEAKPVGKPVVQTAPKVTPTPIRTQQVASKKNSPSIADQKEYKQAQQEQQQYDFNQDKQQAFDEAIAKTKLQSVQPADWVFAAPMFAPMALEGLGALAAAEIPGTGISLGTAANTAAGIHGATQVPQRIQDWQDVAAGEKDWREATAESLMTGLELYGGLSELRALKGVPKQLPGSPNNSLELGKASRTVYPQPITNSMGLREYGSTIHAGPEWGPIAPKRMILYNNSTYADPSLLDESMQPFLLPREELMRRYPTDYMSKDELIGHRFKSGIKPLEYPTEIPAHFNTQEDIMARALGKPLPSRAKPKVYYDLEGNPILEEEALKILNTREYAYGGFMNRSKLNRFIS